MTVNIMITSAGRRAGLSQAFRDAARALGDEARIIAADLRPELSAACALADVAYAVPKVSEPAYVSAILDICAREQVRLVVPTIDPELLPFAAAAEQFASIGVRLHVAETDFVQMAGDKLFTASRLRSVGILTPNTSTSMHDGAPGLPIIIKPRGGSSSVGLHIIRAQHERESFALPEGSIVQELLDGPEYTVNTFYDRAGTFRAAVPHRRIETRGGEMSKGRTERIPALTEIARRIGDSAAGVRGAFCFQAILAAQGPVVFEINARFGGGYPLADHAGGKFARWLLEEVLERESTAADQWQEGVTALRYDVEVYR